MQVNALIAGTQKGGTTALFTFLGSHPQVCVSQRKEIHFFDNDDIFESTEVNYQLYHAQFPTPYSRQTVFIEATPIYMYWNPAPGRIYNYNADMKIILLLRDPVERAYSQWAMETSRRLEKLPFEKAIDCEFELMSRAEDKQDRVRSYLDRGLYSRQIQRLMKFFPQEQLLILKREDLLTYQTILLDRVCDFLHIERYALYPKNRIVLPTKKNTQLPKIQASTRRYLIAFFHDSILELEHITGIQCKAWLH